MQSERKRDERPGAGRVSLIRGILVIVTAVAIGAFMVAQGLGDDADITSAAAASDVEAPSDDSSDEELPVDGAASDDEGADVAGAEASSDGSTADGDAMAEDADDGSMEDESDGTETTETTETAAGTEPAGPEVQAPADVTVLVLNAAGAKGVAGRGSAVLQDAGYDVLAPKNADFLGPSKVLYSEGFEEEAAEVAVAFGVDPVAVVDVLDLNDAPINDTRNANIVVVVGEDGLINV